MLTESAHLWINKEELIEMIAWDHGWKENE